MKMASCHLDRPHDAKGLCHSCYETQRVKALVDRSRVRTNSNKSYARNKKKYSKEERVRAIRFKRAAYELLGGKCAVCGFDDFRALQIDHINGGGVKELRDGSHATDLRYRRVLANPEKYQLLCANHNMIKRYEKKEGPQQLNPGEADELVPKEIEAAILNLGSRQNPATVN